MHQWRPSTDKNKQKKKRLSITKQNFLLLALEPTIQSCSCENQLPWHMCSWIFAWYIITHGPDWVTPPVKVTACFENVPQDSQNEFYICDTAFIFNFYYPKHPHSNTGYWSLLDTVTNRQIRVCIARVDSGILRCTDGLLTHSKHIFANTLRMESYDFLSPYSHTSKELHRSRQQIHDFKNIWNMIYFI